MNANPSLDYETQESYILTLDVSDGSNTVSSSISVQVNDVAEAPVFSSAPATVSISEDQSLPYDVADLNAVDPDGTGTVTYALTSSPAGHFCIDASSKLSSSQPNKHLNVILKISPACFVSLIQPIM